MSSTSNNPDPTGQAPNGTDPTAQAANSTGQAPNEPPNQSQDDLLRQIKELRNENAAHRRKFKEQEDATQAALEQRLKEQGEFKQLAEQHQARVQQLEPVAKQYEELAALVSGQIDAQIKDWPPEIKAFDPGKEATVEARLAWIEKSRPIIAKLQQQTQRPGNGPNPAPGNPTTNDQKNAFMAKLRQSGKYGG